MEQYKFGIGTIKDVCSGDVVLKSSVDKLNLAEDSGIIYIPKVIGVYQKDYENSEEIDLLGGLEQIGIISQIGKPDTLDENLIGILYDPSILQKDLLEKVIDDSLDRVKLTRHVDFDEDELYNKNLGDFDIISRCFFDPSKINLSVLENKYEVLNLSRQDYGLTRKESVSLLVIKRMMIENGLKPEIIKNPNMLGLTQEFLDSLKNSNKEF